MKIQIYLELRNGITSLKNLSTISILESEIFRCKSFQTFNKQSISIIYLPENGKKREGRKNGVIYFPTL